MRALVSHSPKWTLDFSDEALEVLERLQGRDPRAHAAIVEGLSRLETLFNDTPGPQRQAVLKAAFDYKQLHGKKAKAEKLHQIHLGIKNGHRAAIVQFSEQSGRIFVALIYPKNNEQEPSIERAASIAARERLRTQ